MLLKTRIDLSIRYKNPTTSAPKKGIIYKGFEIEVEGKIKGQKIRGKDGWYYDAHQNYYWSGGVEVIDPTPVQKRKESPRERANSVTPPHKVGNQVLGLGKVDAQSMPEVREYLDNLHESTMSKSKLRGDKNEQWIDFQSLSGKPVENLQRGLRFTGFYPFGRIDGIFGYRSQSAVRLFQEYIRSIENDVTIGTPDGVAGPNTYKHLNGWLSQRKQADWLQFSTNNPSKLFKRWRHGLTKIGKHFKTNPTEVLNKVNVFDKGTDTLTSDRWNFDPFDTHLIGIRRKETATGYGRSNDDIFILLTNGLVFKFYGSTDPNTKMTSRSDEPFIVRGQHKYRFGWHKVSQVYKSYRAFKPYSMRGVLIFRDIDDDDQLTQRDHRSAPQANNTINIHWSGKGTTNWSAGCQVISGKSYINHQNELVNCSAFASPGYTNLGPMTRGAYNVLLDLITIFSKNLSVNGGDPLYYTLLYEKDLDLNVRLGSPIVLRLLENMRSS